MARPRLKLTERQLNAILHAGTAMMGREPYPDGVTLRDLLGAVGHLQNEFSRVVAKRLGWRAKAKP